MTQLHELIAVEDDRRTTAQHVLEEATATFTKRAEHFTGHTRNVNMLDGARENENTTETKPMVTTVGDKLSYLAENLEKYWDILLQKDLTNTQALAELTIDGKTIATNLPATFLLHMETQLKLLRNMAHTIPTLSPSLPWAEAPDEGKGVYVANAPTQMKTEKSLEHKILVQATDKHPAQVEKWHIDKPVGKIDVRHVCGMLTPARKSQLLARLDTVYAAVKQARMRANTTTVVQEQLAGAVLREVFGDLI